METLGIEKLQKSVKAVIGLGMTVTKSLEDGNIGTGEWVKIGFDGIKLASALKDFNDIKAEVKNLDPVEVEQLVALVQQEFDISNDAAEAMIEEAFEILFKFVTSFIKK